MRGARFAATLSLLVVHQVVGAQTIKVDLKAITTSESGRRLAEGSIQITETETGVRSSLPSTSGRTWEPAAMYMLISYLAAPALEILQIPANKRNTWIGNGDWHARAETRIEGFETIAGPAGTFRESLKLKTTISGAQTNSDAGDSFVNGARYFWFVRGVGLVRMRYEHANDTVTEAVLLSYEIPAKSDSYFPLATSSRWTYAWKNDYRAEAAIETWTLNGQSTGRADNRSEIEAVDSDSIQFDLHTDRFRKIAAAPEKGFNFPYYLFVPSTVGSDANPRLLVEMNNTGTSSDDFTIHDRRAEKLARQSYAHEIAVKLDAPLLVPTFPRPRKQWRIYTHSLDEDTLLVKSGPLKRIDLQLIEMIRDARALLRRNSIPVQDKVFMHGFSASGTFTNRFAILHPEILRAVAAGGVNGIPTFPIKRWHDTDLPYPVGIADLKRIAQIDFDAAAYKQVAQFVYMGYLDRNDTTLSRDTYCEEHAQLIRSLIGADMGERWQVSQSIYRDLGVPAQCVTYNGTAHTIRPEMIDDVVAFLRANVDEGFAKIEPHDYPFVEFKKIEIAHINGLYWAGDAHIPEFARDLFSGKGHFIITIDEWIDGQDHRQLSTFRENAGFEFVLKAEGYEDVPVTAQTSLGTYSSGKGDFQGFVVGLPPTALSKLARGVEYALTPVGHNEECVWEVNDGVALTRP